MKVRRGEREESPKVAGASEDRPAGGPPGEELPEEGALENGWGRGSSALILLRGDGEIFFVNEAARKALHALGVGTPQHLRDLPPQLQEAARAAAPRVSDLALELGGLTSGIWGIHLPVKELDPEWLRGMVEAEQLAAVGQLAATVAQEIGGPNTSIEVAVDHLLKSGLVSDEQAKVALEKILTQTERITRLTRQLIALADPGQIRLEKVDVREIAEAACELMERSFSESRVQLMTELAEEPVEARADRAHLLQVLVNLLLNARTALEEWQGERKVCVRADANGEWVYLHVEDTGPGIPAAEASRIFLPFVSTTGGTGMGLFLTRQLLVEQGGGIRVTPHNDSGGATFTIHLEKAIDD